MNQLFVKSEVDLVLLRNFSGKALFCNELAELNVRKTDLFQNQ